MTEEERAKIETIRRCFPRWEHIQFEYGRWVSTHENYDASYEDGGYVSNELIAEGRTLDDLAGLSPVVYLGVEAHTVTYRLADDSSWTFSRREARELGLPRIAHLVAA